MRFPRTFVLLVLAAQAGNVSAESASQTFGNDRWVAGDDVAVTGKVEGDAFLAGGRSRVDGRVDGDVVVTGGTIEVRGEVSEDVYAAGGDVRIDARVAGDARAAADSLTHVRTLRRDPFLDLLLGFAQSLVEAQPSVPELRLIGRATETPVDAPASR